MAIHVPFYRRPGAFAVKPIALGVAMAVWGAALALVLCTGVSCNSSSSTPDQKNPPVAEEEYKGPPLFEDVTAKSGVQMTYRNGEEANNYAIIESLGGGIGLIDFDGDGLLDIFIPGGGYFEGKNVLGHPSKLYRNLGGFKFEDVSAKVGLDKVAFQYSHGATAFDFDCDGWTDILVTGYSELILLHNEADGTGGRRFVNVTKKAKLDDHLWSTSAGCGDLDGDGYPEIYVAHYGDWGFNTNHPTDCTYDGKTRDVCQPRKFKPLPHTIYRNNRDGTFTDVSAELKLRTDGKGIGVLLVDANNDGRPDIYVANDTDDNYLYLNRGDRGQLKLEEVGLLANVSRDDRGLANGSMGVDAGDFNRSGRASLLVTNYENELPALYRNDTTGKTAQFTYATLPSKIAIIGGSYVSWGTGFFDYDHDGWDDILIVSGHAVRFPTKIDRRQKPMLLHNDAGKFKATANQGGSYFREPHNARGAALGDLDNDGKIDIVVSHLNEPVVILRNVAADAGHHWIGIELVGEKHRDIVGARMVIETASATQTKYAKGGGSYGSTSDRRMVFGLGADTEVKRATVYWSSGKAQEITNLKPGAYWRVSENEKDAHQTEARKP